MQEIKPTYCTFEQAKKLKEKGFNIPVRQRSSIVENIYGDKFHFVQEECGLFNWNNGKYPEYISAPQQHQVVEWLRVNHGIYIQSTFNNNMERYNIDIINVFTNLYVCTIDGRTENKKDYGWNSPQEAYSAAFDYILKELI
jgi:hypothetical protein